MVSANALDFHSLKDKENITQSIPCSMCTEDDPVTTHCPACSKFLCEFCSKAHKRQVDYRDHKIVSLDDLDSETLRGFERSRRCSRHSGELLKLYCKTCHKLICRDCTLVDHHNHTFGFSKDIRPDIQKQVECSVEVLNTKRKELNCHLKFVNDIEKSRSSHSKGLEREINTAFDSYIATVESRRKTLLEQERKANDRDLKQIWAQKEFIEMKLASIDGSMRYANRLCSCPSDLDMLEMSVEATQQLSNLSEVEWNPTSQLQLPVPLVFSAVASLNQDAIGIVNPVSLQYFSVSISRADSMSVQSTLPQHGVQYDLQTGRRPSMGVYSRAEYAVGHEYGSQGRYSHGMPTVYPNQVGYNGQAGHNSQVELGKAVQLVVHLQSSRHLHASVSSSLIMPSISVTTQYYGATSANYVLTHQDDGSWMITVTPLHGGTYYVTASLQQRPARSESRDITYFDDPQTTCSPTVAIDFSTAQYTFSVIGTPNIGARVRRGPNWPQGNTEDGGIGNRGTVIHPFTQQHLAPQSTVGPFTSQYPTQQLMPRDDIVQWDNGNDVYVQWDTGNKNRYQWGHSFPIELVPY